MEELYETIENYLHGKLPEAAHRAFAERLQQEPELRAEVEAFRLSEAVIEEGIADRLRTDFAAWDLETPQQQPARVVALRSVRRWVAVAASLLVLSFTFLQWRSTQQNYNSDTLAAFYHNNDLGITRSGSTIDNELRPALAAIQSENYPLAIQQLLTVSDTASFYPDARYLLADTYFRDGQYDESEAALAPLLAGPDVLLKEKAEWLQVLIALKEGKKNDPEFQQRLNRISSDPNHSFQPSAAALQQTLAGFWVQWVD